MEKIIPLDSYSNLPLLFGTYNHNLKLIKEAFNVKIIARDNLRISGDKINVEKVPFVINAIHDQIREKGTITALEVEEIISIALDDNPDKLSTVHSSRNNSGIFVQPRTEGQKRYIQAMRDYEIVFAIGPSGTGKTYLAVAMAVEALKQGAVKKIVLVRPAVEAGERLGFLPGDYQAKINPYLRPLYDSLHNLVEYNSLKRYMDKDIVEIAPLAYMRGRTLESAFIILDEAQNTTATQMKMFLTRLGINSRIVVTGDITQVDLDKQESSGLVHAQSVLQNIPGICFYYLTKQDIVRHRLVQKIVEAYEHSDAE